MWKRGETCQGFRLAPRFSISQGDGRRLNFRNEHTHVRLDKLPQPDSDGVPLMRICYLGEERGRGFSWSGISSFTEPV